MPGDGTDLRRLEDRIGYRFRRRELLDVARTHASAEPVHNERLEFLGDAVLNLVAAEVLFMRHPHEREGRLTEWKALLVARLTLEQAGHRLGLESFLRIGGSLEQRGSLPRSLAGNAFEALLGAVYLDAGEAGLATCKDLVERLLEPELASLEQDFLRRSAKKDLQNRVQAEFGTLPVYTVVEVYEHPEASAFCVRAAIGQRTFAAAWGSSKKSAERRAAWECLLVLNCEGTRGPEEAGAG